MNTRLPKKVGRKMKIVGRGYGSGKGGHTVGRGQKGQKSRESVGVLFEGMKMRKSLIKRLPLKRGKGKFKSRNKTIVVNLKVLNVLPQGSVINVDSLISNGIINKNDAQKCEVKILGEGKLEKKLTIELPISKSASEKVVKAGGKVVRN